MRVGESEVGGEGGKEGVREPSRTHLFLFGEIWRRGRVRPCGADRLIGREGGWRWTVRRRRRELGSGEGRLGGVLCGGEEGGRWGGGRYVLRSGPGGRWLVCGRVDGREDGHAQPGTAGKLTGWEGGQQVGSSGKGGTGSVH